jgi:hypothetical protein
MLSGNNITGRECVNPIASMGERLLKGKPKLFVVDIA